jgi:outer membrane receptor for ferrienterochelin and colicins
MALAIMSAFSMQQVHAQTATTNEKELAPVIVTGVTGYDQDIINAPASISVITREELSNKSYTTIADAIKDVPGISVVGGGSSQEISIRGMSSAYTMYLIDGKPVSTATNISTNGTANEKYGMALPPLSMIERIEVIRGPMSSLYGSEAMGGVVNIITRKYSKTWTGSIGAEYTMSNNDISNDSRQVDFFASGPLVEGLLGMQIVSSYVDHDESTFVGGEAQKSDESRPESKRHKLGAKFVLTPNQNNDISLSFDTSSRRDYHTPGKSLAVGEIGTQYQLKKEMVNLEHNGRYGNWQTNTYLQHDKSDNALSELPKNERVTILNNQTTYFGGNNTYSFGAQYKKEELTNEANALWTANPRPATAVKEMDRWLAAIFAEAEWGLTEQFKLTTGARYNHDQNFGGHITPRIYGVYQANEHVTIKGGVSTGYKQPTLPNATEGFGQTTGGNTSNVSPRLPHSRAVIIGNPDVKPEKSTSFELAMNYHNPDIGLFTGITAFHTKFKDKISELNTCRTEPVGVTTNQNVYANWACPALGDKYYFTSKQINVQDADMSGIEIAFDKTLTNALKLRGSYTFTKSEQKSGAFKGQPLTQTPKHVFHTNLDWQAMDNLNAWMQYNYRSATSDYLDRTSMKPGTPGYGFFDIGMKYKFNRDVSLKAGVYNLANKEVTNMNGYGVVLDGRRFNVGLNVDF